MDFYNVPHDTWINTTYKKEYDKNPLFVQSIRYYDRYLLEKAMSVFKWDIPDNWELNYLLFNLYTRGFVCVSKYAKYGIIPQFCTISGFNIFYNPAECKISNPYIKTNEKYKTVELGKNGDLLTLTPDYCGILDLINTYSEMLSNALCAVNTNLYNSRLAYIFYAKNKSQADSYKAMYDKIGTGTPAVVVDSKLFKEDLNGDIIPPFFPFNAELAKNYITSNVLEDMHRIENMFNQKIGIPITNTEKKERMNNDEVNKSDIESNSTIALWYDMLKRSIVNIKKLYPDLNLNVSYRYPLNISNSNLVNGETGNVSFK